MLSNAANLKPSASPYCTGNLPKLSSLVGATPFLCGVAFPSYTTPAAPPLASLSPALSRQLCGGSFPSCGLIRDSAPPSKLIQSSALSPPDPQARSSGRPRGIWAPLSEGSASPPQAPPPPAYSSRSPRPCGPCGFSGLPRAPSPAPSSASPCTPAPPRPVAFLRDQGQVPTAASRREGAGGGGGGGGEKGGLLTPSLALPVRGRRFATNGPRTPAPYAVTSVSRNSPSNMEAHPGPMRCPDVFSRSVGWSLALQRTGGESWRKCVYAAPRGHVYPGGRRRRLCCCRRCHSLCRHGLSAAVPVPPPGAPLSSGRHRVPRPEDPKARETRGCLRNCDTGAPAGPGAAGVSAGSRARACGAGAGVASSASRSPGPPSWSVLPRRLPHAGSEPRRAPPAMSPDWRWPVSTGRGRAAVPAEKGPPRRGALGASWAPGRGGLTGHSFAATACVLWGGLGQRQEGSLV